MFTQVSKRVCDYKNSLGLNAVWMLNDLLRSQVVTYCKSSNIVQSICRIQAAYLMST